LATHLTCLVQEILRKRLPYAYPTTAQDWWRCWKSTGWQKATASFWVVAR
jgi:hypothetical protein